MAKKKKEEKYVPSEKITEVIELYDDALDKEPKYSLKVDPTNKYCFTEEQSKFVEYYIQFKSVLYAASLLGITEEEANAWFASYGVQQEIRRINLALYHRQFKEKMLSLDDLGGYLTSLLTTNNVPFADQPKNIDDKLKVVKLIMDLTELKQKSIQNPNELLNKDISVEIKELSVTTIKQLIENEQNMNKEDLFKSSKLSPEEVSYLKTLPTKDLLKIIDKQNNKKEKL